MAISVHDKEWPDFREEILEAVIIGDQEGWPYGEIVDSLIEIMDDYGAVSFT